MRTQPQPEGAYPPQPPPARSLVRIALPLPMTDVVMPGMSGRALADQVAARRPEIKVLYVWRYTDNAIVQHGVLEADMMFLWKPFTLRTLARKLEEILGPDQPETA